MASKSHVDADKFRLNHGSGGNGWMLTCTNSDNKNHCTVQLRSNDERMAMIHALSKTLPAYKPK